MTEVVMHEYSLISGLLAQLRTLMETYPDHPLDTVHVRIGALAQISTEHFREHFYHAVEGTDLEHVRLDVTMDHDPDNVNAQDIILESIELLEH